MSERMKKHPCIQYNVTRFFDENLQKWKWYASPKADSSEEYKKCPRHSPDFDTSAEVIQYMNGRQPKVYFYIRKKRRDKKIFYGGLEVKVFGFWLLVGHYHEEEMFNHLKEVSWFQLYWRWTKNDRMHYMRVTNPFYWGRYRCGLINRLNKNSYWNEG